MAAFLFFIFFPFTPVTARWYWNEIVCDKTPSLYTYIPSLSVCMLAISLIPSGEFTVDPGYAATDGKLDLHLCTNARDQKYLIPAAFHYGTCAIMVDASESVTPGKKQQPPLNGASQLYSVVWPRVREVATKTARLCYGWNDNKPNWKGSVLTKSKLGEYEYEYPYYVSVAGTPGVLPEIYSHKMKILTPTHLGRVVDYHVYEVKVVGGTAG